MLWIESNGNEGFMYPTTGNWDLRFDDDEPKNISPHLDAAVKLISGIFCGSFEPPLTILRPTPLVTPQLVSKTCQHLSSLLEAKLSLTYCNR